MAGWEPKAYERMASPAEEDAYRAERKRISENHFNRSYTLAAWPLATLAGINGTAAALMVGGLTKRSAVSPAAALAFIFGVVLAVLAGFLGTQEARDRSNIYYVESMRPEQLTDHGRAVYDTCRRRAWWLRQAGAVLNYLSLAAFVGGVAIASSTFTIAQT